MYLINVCVMECDLYQYFFQSKSPGLRYELLVVFLTIRMLLEGFSTILYDNIRPIIIRCRDMDMLCSLVHILRNKIMQDELNKKGELTESIRPIIEKIQSDIQGMATIPIGLTPAERLIFISMDILRTEVKEFIPTDEVLLPRPTQEAKEEKPQESIEEGQEQYGNWYPPLRSTLLSLSKLYLCLDVSLDQLATYSLFSERHI